MSLRSIVLCCCVLFAPCASIAQVIFPGGVAELRIDKLTAELPEIRYGLREPVIIEESNHWRILIGISLDTLPGTYLVYLKHNLEGTSGEHQTIKVDQQHYPLIEGDAKSAALLRREHKTFSEIDFSNTQQPSLPLLLPAKGAWSETFGHQHYDAKKDILMSLNAISMTTTELAMVVAPQNAIVSKVEPDESGSATVFLDHGRGLYSILEGVADLTVAAGNGIVAGAVIGKMAAIEPESNIKRLIWQTRLNNTYVNPMILTELEP